MKLKLHIHKTYASPLIAICIVMSKWRSLRGVVLTLVVLLTRVREFDFGLLWSFPDDFKPRFCLHMILAVGGTTTTVTMSKWHSCYNGYLNYHKIVMGEKGIV